MGYGQVNVGGSTKGKTLKFKKIFENSNKAVSGNISIAGGSYLTEHEGLLLVGGYINTGDRVVNFSSYPSVNGATQLEKKRSKGGFTDTYYVDKGANVNIGNANADGSYPDATMYAYLYYYE